MVSKQKVLVVGRAGFLNEGMQQLLQRGPPGDRYQTVLGADLSALPAREAVELVIVVPWDWRDLNAWLPALLSHVGSVFWLVIADLPLAGLFFPIHDPHRCGLLSRDATTEELEAALAALSDGHPLFRPEGHAPLLMDHAPPVSGRQLPAPTQAEFQCGCGIALEMANARIASILSVSEATVKRHVSDLLHKFRFKSRRQIGELFNQALVYPSPPSAAKKSSRKS